MVRRLKSLVLDQLPPKRRQRVTIEIHDEKLLQIMQASFNELRALDVDEDAKQFDK